MKRYIRCAEDTHSTSKQIRSDELARMQSYLEPIVHKIETQNHVKLKLIQQNWVTYSGYSCGIECSLTEISVDNIDLTVKNDYSGLKLFHPIIVESEYGDIVINELPFISGRIFEVFLSKDFTSWGMQTRSMFEDTWYHIEPLSDESKIIASAPDDITIVRDKVKAAFDKVLDDKLRHLASLESGVPAMITYEIEKNVASTYNSFIDGDTFAYGQDEGVYTGKISKCIQRAHELVTEHPELRQDSGELYSALFDDDTIRFIYNMSTIRSLFRRHHASYTS